CRRGDAFAKHAAAKSTKGVVGSPGKATPIKPSASATMPAAINKALRVEFKRQALPRAWALLGPGVPQTGDAIEHGSTRRVVMAVCHEVAVAFELEPGIGRRGGERRFDVSRDHPLALRIQAGEEILATGVGLRVSEQAIEK